MKNPGRCTSDREGGCGRFSFKQGLNEGNLRKDDTQDRAQILATRFFIQGVIKRCFVLFAPTIFSFSAILSMRSVLLGKTSSCPRNLEGSGVGPE